MPSMYLLFPSKKLITPFSIKVDKRVSRVLELLLSLLECQRELLNLSSQGSLLLFDVDVFIVFLLQSTKQILSGSVESFG